MTWLVMGAEVELQVTSPALLGLLRAVACSFAEAGSATASARCLG